MKIEEFEKLTKEELEEYGKKIPTGSTFEGENMISFKDYKGFWEVNTYDKNGNQTSCWSSLRNWWKMTYDEENNESSYTNNKNYYEIKGEEVSKEEYEEFIKS